MKDRIWRSIASMLLCIVFLTQATLHAPASLAADVTTQYKMAVDVDYDLGTVSAVEKVSYTNTTGRTLDSLVFNVTPAHYKALSLLGVRVDGQPIEPTLDGVVLTLPLSKGLQPNASVEVVLSFQLRVPSPGNLRFGKSSGILALGNWYPVLVTFDAAKGDWDRYQYVDTGDAFFTEIADYEIDLQTNRPLIAGYTGVAQRLAPTRWQIGAQRVRDFALALSDRYEVKSAYVDGITVTALYLPQHSAGGTLYLRVATEVLQWANETLGRYPYASLFVVETASDDPAWVGQEYPNVVFISSQMTAGGGGMGSYLSYLVAHEVLHQWFYGIVGNDQVNHPWLDEATVTHLSYQFFRARYPDIYPGMWQRFVEGEQSGIRAFGDRPVNSTIYDYDDEGHYFIIVYRKGAIFLEELRETIGDEAYSRFLQQVVSRFAFRTLSPADFFSLAQANSSTDLGPIIRRYFSYPRYSGALDYDLPNGHFYTQANGHPLGTSEKGFAIVDDTDAPMWSEYQRLGGPAGLGYPISRRFRWDGFVSQAMQKGVMQWQPQSGRAYLVNVFDEMSRRGLDGWLLAVRQVPQMADWHSDAGKAWPDVVRAHLAILESDQAIKGRYFAYPDPLVIFGLPMSFGDMGNNYTLRAQRAVIQRWKIDTPWAAAGDVTVANGGDIAKESGLIPNEALEPEDAP